jgi:hypothetical protein
MISIFQDPYDGELFYSLMARNASTFGYSNVRTINRNFFGSDQVIATVAFPSHLDDLIERLPQRACYSARKFIDQHTLLPFFAPFLPVQRVEQLQADMRGRQGPSIHMRSGVMASSIPLPATLRYCPECVIEDRCREGECYWHSLHQLPGVLICTRHDVWLEASEVSVPQRTRRMAYVPAENVLKDYLAPARSVLPTKSGQVLRFLAESAVWLLTRGCFSCGLNMLHQWYLKALFKRDLATYRGRVSITELQEAFVAFYSADMLNLLQCPLDFQSTDHWLARLVRKPDGAQHPLQHLLLIHFLGEAVESFFTQGEKCHPFGKGPWPCLNKASLHYHQLTIPRCAISYPSSMGGSPTGVFTCPCGFIYSRSGPDTSSEDQHRRGKILEYGRVWDHRLRCLWADPLWSVNRIAEELGVDPVTVKRQALRLGMELTRPGRAHGERLKAPPQRQRNARSVRRKVSKTVMRHLWVKACQTHPQSGTKELRRQQPRVFAWLYRHDRHWLRAHQPARRKPRHLLRVDWVRRDEMLARALSAAALQLRNRVGRPVRITIAALGHQIGQAALLQQHLDKLPQASKSLKELVESREAFAVRRIWWTATHYVQEQYCPQRWELVKRAGVERLANLPSVQAALTTAVPMISKQIASLVQMTPAGTRASDQLPVLVGYVEQRH